MKILFFLLLNSFSILLAADVDTVIIYSETMQKSPKAVVILPHDYNTSDTVVFPVVYLLHGWSGNYSNWIKKADLSTLVDTYNIVVVCPDGGYAGWYLNSPLRPDSQYETYIANEVIDYVDTNYKTIKSMLGRAICGLSMGGHGAISLLAKNPDLFIAGSSMSGVLDLSMATKKYGLINLLGTYEDNKQVWEKNSCLNLAKYLVNKNKGIMIDCGIEDHFIDTNRKFHDILVKLKVAHDYTERPGGHSWEYWVNALEYHLLFFHKIWISNGLK